MDYRNSTRCYKMGIISQSRILVVLFSFLALAAFAVWAPTVEASPNFYSTECASCHGTNPTTCNGCHQHGPRNLNATTNKTTYEPGEALTVSFSGGQQSGWIRAILYLNNQEVARSTGPSSMGGGAGFPITFSTMAPDTPGTYTYQAAWFGNTNNGGGTHGEERISSNSFTVSAPVPVNTPPTADAGSPQTVTAGSGGTASVTLNGSGSSDPEGPIASYSWSGPFGTATGVSPTVTLGEGTHTITLTVTDSDGASEIGSAPCRERVFPLV